MATSHLERVNALIALAIDKASSAEESRTAALQAVKLIHKHKLLTERTRSAPATSAPKWGPGPPVEPMWRARYDPKQACGGWRIMSSPNRALCGVCNRIVRKDDPIMFLSGEPYMHPSCWEAWVSAQQSQRSR